MLLTRGYPVPDNEAARLAALQSYRLLDTPADATLDGVVQLARGTFQAAVSLISLIDDQRQWFKARAGWNGLETRREHSFCSHAIMSRDVMVIPDASEDMRFRDNPFVVGEPCIRFYAGAPLTTPRGFRIGTLCLVDPRPREGLATRERRQLASLARFAMAEIHKAAMPELGRRPRTRPKLRATISAYRRASVEVEVVNMSERAALIRCDGVAWIQGEEVVLALRDSSSVATVAWSRESMLGLTFHRPFDEAHVRALVGRAYRP